MKIVSIVGARPQIIKSAALVPYIIRNNNVITIHTGQHYDYQMSKIHYNSLQITEPNYNLEIGSGTHSQQVGNIMIKLEKILIKENPDLVIVYGDTNSTLASAITAAKLEIPIAHIEAGLRLNKIITPEEINRRAVDSICSLYFPPTKTAMENLIMENHNTNSFLCGDVMVDILNNTIKKKNSSGIEEKYNITKGEYILLTIHRPVNTESISTLREVLITLMKTDFPVVFPIHPRTKKILNKLSNKININQIQIIDPIDYNTFIHLEKYANKIITDSGGVQKESYILGIPCITLLNWTCWQETVDEGMNILVGTNSKRLLEAISYQQPKVTTRDIFGDGHASYRINKKIKQFF